MVGSRIDLAGAELELVGKPHREKILLNVLRPVTERYDYILIDCSPSLGLITVNALTAADSVIIPVQAEYFALEGISKLLNTIRIIKSKLNPQLEIEGFLLFSRLLIGIIHMSRYLPLKRIKPQKEQNQKQRFCV